MGLPDKRERFHQDSGRGRQDSRGGHQKPRGNNTRLNPGIVNPTLSPADDERINESLGKAVKNEAAILQLTGPSRLPRSINVPGSVQVTYILTDGTVQTRHQELDPETRMPIDEY